MKPRVRRARRIRRYVVTSAVTVFLAVWSFIYTEMRSGDAPALGSQSTTTGSTAVSSSAGGSSGGSATSSSSTPSAVTTQQS